MRTGVTRASTIVDGATARCAARRRGRPRADPRRSHRCRRHPRPAGSPVRLALVAVSGCPHASARARAIGWDGTRTATVSVPPCTAGAIDGRCVETRARAVLARTPRPVAHSRRGAVPTKCSTCVNGRGHERQRQPGGTSLEVEDGGDGVRLRRIDGQAVERLGGKYDDATLPNPVRGVADRIAIHGAAATRTVSACPRDSRARSRPASTRGSPACPS